MTTSIDYLIVSKGSYNAKELSTIRNKNYTFWQAKPPKDQIKIEINFLPSRLSHIEISTLQIFFNFLLFFKEFF